MTQCVDAALRSLGRVLQGLRPMAIPDLGNASLLERFDTKFIVPVERVPELVAACASGYCALEVDGRRVFCYETHYFDTPTFAHYHRHLAGHLPRHKVRIRSYLDTGTHTLELKRTTNQGRTEKLRRAIDACHERQLSWLDDPSFRAMGSPPPASLCPAVRIRYRRITLVSITGGERVTIDLEYHGASATSAIALPDWAIVEVKQLHRGRSLALDALRGMRQRPHQVSKYCLGIAALVPGIRRQRYRRLLTRLAPDTHVDVLSI